MMNGSIRSYYKFLLCILTHWEYCVIYMDQYTYEICRVLRKVIGLQYERKCTDHTPRIMFTVMVSFTRGGVFHLCHLSSYGDLAFEPFMRLTSYSQSG